MPFRFRHFAVEDQSSTMRVGTDAMILGAWAMPPERGRILDVGTGCGVLALMMAQKTKATVDAIEIDGASACQAEQNFRNSPWYDRMNLFHGDLSSWFGDQSALYDFILSNPPYFSNSLKSDHPGRNQARHDISLNYSTLFRHIRQLLKPDGECSAIFPADTMDLVSRETMVNGLFAHRFCYILPFPAGNRIRVLGTWSIRKRSAPEETELVIRNEHGAYSKDYLDLTREYHQFIP